MSTAAEAPLEEEDSEIEPPSSAEPSPTAQQAAKNKKEKKSGRFGGMREKFKKKSKPKGKAGEGKQATAGTEGDAAGADGGTAESAQEASNDGPLMDADTSLAEEAAAEKLLGDANDDEGPTTPAGFNPLSVKRPKGWAFRMPIHPSLPLRSWRIMLYVASGCLLVVVCTAVQVLCLYRSMCYRSTDPSVDEDLGQAIVPTALILLAVVVPHGIAAAESEVALHAGLQCVLSAGGAVALCVLFSIGFARYGKVEEERAPERWASMSLREKTWFNSSATELEERMSSNLLAASVSALATAITLAAMGVSSGRVWLSWLRAKLKDDYAPSRKKALPR
jgi:hypothetical protein